MNQTKFIEIIKPDDWHIHLREGEMLMAVINSSTRINARCVVMPNLKVPITSSAQSNLYKNEIAKLVELDSFQTLIPCYLTDNLDLDYIEILIREKFLFGKEDETLYIIKKNDN